MKVQIRLHSHRIGEGEIRRLFIDSGKGHPGFAMYVGNKLAGVSEYPPERDWADEVYFEMPVYNRHRSTSPQSLIKLAAAGALAAGRAAGPGVHVGEIDVAWKGNVPKSVCRTRLIAALSDGERVSLAASICDVPKSKQHDLYDAAYMGLKWFQERGLRT